MQKKQTRHPLEKKLIPAAPALVCPFDREADALRMPALLAPRLKSLNGIWMMSGRRAKPGESFFAQDFEAHDWQGFPVPGVAGEDVRILRLLREFELDSSWLKRENGSVFLRIDGISPNTSIWINAVPVGRGEDRKNDFAGFDITGAVQPGVNRIAVLLRRTGKGPLGILRGIHLILQPVTGSPEVQADSRSIPLPLLDPADDADDFPVRGPRRDPVSLEDDGEDLWISATNGLLSCFGRETGTVESLDLDGVSLMDRGPLPAGPVSWSDITLARKNGHAELESLASGVRIGWRFLRSGRIRFTAELSPKKGKDGLVMHLPPHLDRLYWNGADRPCALSQAGIRLTDVRGLVLSSDLGAGLAILFRESADVTWQKHCHSEKCHHHDCGCSADHGGSELILKTHCTDALFRFDFRILPFAAGSLNFHALFPRSES